MQRYDKERYPFGPPKGLRPVVVIWFLWPFAAWAVLNWSQSLILFVALAAIWFASIPVLVLWTRRVSKRQRELAKSSDN